MNYWATLPLARPFNVEQENDQRIMDWKILFCESSEPNIINLFTHTYSGVFYTTCMFYSHPRLRPFLPFFYMSIFLVPDGECRKFRHLQTLLWSRDSSVGIATGYGLADRGVGVRVPVGSRIFSSPRRTDRLWGQPNFLSNEYPWGKAAGA
jgi:hypothetical protein